MSCPGRDGECWQLQEGTCEARPSSLSGSLALSERGPWTDECALPGPEPGRQPHVSSAQHRARPEQAREAIRVVIPPPLQESPPWSTSSLRHPLPAGNVQSFLSPTTLAGRSPFWTASTFPPVHPPHASSSLLPLPRHPPRGLPSVLGRQPDSRPARTQLWAGSRQRVHTHALFPSQVPPPLSGCLEPRLKTPEYPPIAASPKPSCRAQVRAAGGRRAPPMCGLGVQLCFLAGP